MCTIISFDPIWPFSWIMSWFSVQWSLTEFAHCFKVVLLTTFITFFSKCWTISFAPLMAPSTIITFFIIFAIPLGSINTDKTWVYYSQHLSLSQFRLSCELHTMLPLSYLFPLSLPRDDLVFLFSMPKINWSFNNLSASFLYLHSDSASLNSDIYELLVCPTRCCIFLN